VAFLIGLCNQICIQGQNRSKKKPSSELSSMFFSDFPPSELFPPKSILRCSLKLTRLYEQRIGKESSMFGEFRQMIDFLTLAPFFILGSFLTTFTAVKIAQSEALYRFIEGKLDVWRTKQVRAIRLEMGADIAFILRGRQEQELSPREQKIYYRMLDSYYDKVERLYGVANKDREDV